MRYVNEYIKIKEDNWWFVSRSSFIFYLIKKYGSGDKHIKVIDIGCANGNLLFYLRDKGYKNLFGVDYSQKLIENVDFKEIDVRQCDASKTDFENEVFDVVVSSDSLEHMDDDLSVLVEIKRILKKDGIFVLFVPAFDFLWSYHDIINEHKRRYTKRDLIEKLEKSGFVVKKSSYWNFFMFFPAFFIRLIKNMFKIRTNDFYNLPYFLNKLIIYILSFENFMVRFINFPFGISIFAVSQKQSEVI